MVWRKNGFSLPRLLLCEGPDDVAFLERFIEARGISPYHISDTSTAEAPNGGNSGFSRALRAAKFNPNFASVTKIVVLSDNDGDPTDSFAKVRAQVEEAGFDGPQADRQPTCGRPSITVVMVPLGGNPGTLEALCVEAAHSANAQIADHVKSFGALLRADDWPASRAGKFYLRSSLAARCAQDPFVPLGRAIRDYPDLIPLHHASFTPLEALLAQLA